MLDILNVIFLASTITSQSINVVANAESDIEIQEGVRVYPISMKQQAPYGFKKCQYSGVMVQYARDWEEVKNLTGNILPPEPEKPIGYALILNKEICPDKEPNVIFSTGSKFFYPLFGKNFVIREGHRMDAVDYASQPEWLRPKWMPQVLKTIEEDAKNNQSAQAFLTDIKSKINTEPMAKKE